VSSLLRTLLHISNDIWSNNCTKHVQAVDSLGQLARQQRIDFDYDIPSGFSIQQRFTQLKLKLNQTTNQKISLKTWKKEQCDYRLRMKNSG
jgi:hypothetical protein